MGWQVCMFPCQHVSIWGNFFLCLPFAFVSDIPHKRSRGWERLEKIESHLSYSVHQTFVVASQVLTEWMKWEHFENRFSSHSVLPAFLWKAMHQPREVDLFAVKFWHSEWNGNILKAAFHLILHYLHFCEKLCISQGRWTCWLSTCYQGMDLLHDWLLGQKNIYKKSYYWCNSYANITYAKRLNKKGKEETSVGA